MHYFEFAAEAYPHFMYKTKIFNKVQDKSVSQLDTQNLSQCSRPVGSGAIHDVMHPCVAMETQA